MRAPVSIAVLVGSPRPAGSCAALASFVARGVENADAHVELVRLTDYAFAGCVGCGACETTGACVFDAREARQPQHRQGFLALYERLTRCDGLALVAPVYFSGPPSQLKALFDRMQPLWAQRYILGTRPPLPLEQRCPFDLFAVGAGGDPFGFDSLVTCARSSLRMANYELRAVHDCVGYRTGRIADEAFERMAQEEGTRLVEAVRAR